MKKLFSVLAIMLMALTAAAADEKPAAPTFGTEPGKYLTRVGVEIIRPYEGADVYYTTNGSTPTALSEILNPKGYVTIDKEGKSTIKAVTIKDEVVSEVASLEIEIIKPKLSVTNIDEKYEGWTARVIDYNNNTDDLLSSAQQSILIFTQDFALQFSNSDTWEEHYAKMTAGGEYVTVKDNKIEISYVSTTDADSYFAIAFFEDGMTCGSKFEMRDTHEITIDDQGVFNANEFDPEPIFIGTLRSDNEETVVSEGEKALAALMGKTVYAMDYDGAFTSLYINRKGQLTTTIVAPNTNITMPIASFCSITKDGNNYIATSSMGGDNSYTFVVEDGKVTKIDYYEEGTFVQSLLPSAEYTLAALMGSSEYTDGNRTFRVNNDGKIEDVRDETFILSKDFTFALKADGNYELTGKYEDCKYDNLIFYVVNQKVTKIEYYFKDNLTGTYLPPAEDVLVALMGDTKYSYFSNIIQVNTDGKIEKSNEDDEDDKLLLSGNFTFSVDEDGNYVTDIYNDYKFIFYVENQKVTKIDMYIYGELIATSYPPLTITAPASLAGWHAGYYAYTLFGHDDLKGIVDNFVSLDEIDGDSWDDSQRASLEETMDWQRNKLRYPDGQIASDGTFDAGILGAAGYVAYFFCDQATLAEGANWKIYVTSAIGQTTLTDEDLYLSGTFGQGVATAVTAPAAEKGVKAVKVIENGEIVIIRGGERFNLRGAKIK